MKPLDLLERAAIFFVSHPTTLNKKLLDNAVLQKFQNRRSGHWYNAFYQGYTDNI